MRAKIITSLFGAVVLSGCANFGMGESDFSCQADGSQGNAAACKSAAEVYALTERPGPVTDERIAAADSEAEGSEAVDEQSGAWRNDEASSEQPEPVQAQRLPEPGDPLPLRTPAKVMRVWVAPWESSTGDLNVTGAVYTEIEERRWSVGEPEPETESSLRPLQQRQQEMLDESGE